MKKKPARQGKDSSAIGEGQPLAEPAPENPQWAIDMERNRVREKSRNVVLLVIAAAAAIAGMMWGVSAFQRANDPLVKGIPPRDNGDGTIDYTLIGRGFWDEQKHEFQVAEWVLRLPAKNVVYLGKGDDAQMGNNGSWATTLKSNPNNFLASQFMIADMAPVASDQTRPGTMIPVTEGAFELAIRSGRTGDDGTGAAYRFQKIYTGEPNQACISTGRIVYGMEEFRAGTKIGGCSLADTTYVLWTDSARTRVSAFFQCKSKDHQPTCSANWRFGNRTAYGSISYRYLREFVPLTDRVQKFIEKATVVDRVYRGKPFVLGGNGDGGY